jgi:hypothetical protein
MARMVPVATAGSSFEARVIAARLGADGIIWQFRGTLDGPLGPLPGGEVTVLVVEADYEAARDLLLADEVEASFAEPADAHGASRTAASGSAGTNRRADWGRAWWIAAGVALAVLFAVARFGSAF